MTSALFDELRHIAGIAAPASVNGLAFIGWQEPIGCGGCAIFPGDIIGADDVATVVTKALYKARKKTG
jgi:regulator of RNase E activity RraA